MESIPGEDAVKIVEMTTKDLKYYPKVVDKAAAGLERTNFKKKKKKKFRSGWNAIEQDLILQRNHWEKGEPIDAANFTVVFF